jgi:hypothetical protein
VELLSLSSNILLSLFKTEADETEGGSMVEEEFIGLFKNIVSELAKHVQGKGMMLST